MGNAAFYFYPEPNGSQLVTIDLGEPLGELFFDFDIEESTATSMTGSMYRTFMMQRQVITIQRDRLKLKEDMANRLRALESHLNRGFSCGFTCDTDKSFIYPIQNFPYSGDTAIKVMGDPFRNMTGSKVPVLDDYCAIDTPNVAATYEVGKYASTTGAFSSSNGGQINLANGVNFTYDRPAFLRYYRFWPTLKRADAIGESIITNENGILFSLSIRLVVDTSLLFSFHPLMTGDDGTIRYDLGATGQIVPRETAFGNLTNFTSPDRVAREIDSGLTAFPRNDTFPHRQ